ncbi:hypothetical protein TcasGA2_TC032863 [Tribolium castaneum]|uniref:Uncharacterized protein n=1 Tax=Tribolium castaneum TaxID=7070 RepID=A0A139WJP8_TRICA|nr:hypothetical protein TcasGA2_TC032863 [Tribolium castaneum]
MAVWLSTLRNNKSDNRCERPSRFDYFEAVLVGVNEARFVNIGGNDNGVSCAMNAFLFTAVGFSYQDRCAVTYFGCRAGGTRRLIQASPPETSEISKLISVKEKIRLNSHGRFSERGNKVDDSTLEFPSVRLVQGRCHPWPTLTPGPNKPSTPYHPPQVGGVAMGAPTSNRLPFFAATTLLNASGSIPDTITTSTGDIDFFPFVDEFTTVCIFFYLAVPIDHSGSTVRECGEGEGGECPRSLVCGSWSAVWNVGHENPAAPSTKPPQQEQQRTLTRPIELKVTRCCCCSWCRRAIPICLRSMLTLKTYANPTKNRGEFKPETTERGVRTADPEAPDRRSMKTVDGEATLLRYDRLRLIESRLKQTR